MSNMHGPRNFGPPRPNMMPPRGGRFGGPNFRGPRPGGFMPRGPNQGQGPPSRPPFGGGNFRPPPMNQGGQGMMGHDINRPPGPGMPPIRPGGPMFMGPPPGMGGPMRSGGPDGPMPMPCGSPLPIIDPSKEVWVETLSPDGKTYYYHAKTRETVWKRPAADNIQIIKQSEAHVLANPAAFGGFRPQLQSQQQPPQQQPQQQQLPQTVQQQQQPIQQQQPQQQQPQQHQPQQPSLQQHEHEPRMLLPSVDNTSVPLSSEVKETNNDVTMQNDEEPAIESPNSNAKSSVNQENNKDTDMEIEATESSANDDDDKSGKSPGNNEVSMNDSGSPQTQNSSALPLKIGADTNAPPTDSMPPPNNIPQNSPPVQNNMTPQNNPSPPQQNNAPPQINSQPLNGSMPSQSNMPQHQNNNTGMQPMLPNNMQPPNNMPMQSNNMRPPMMNNGPPMQQPMRPMMMGPGPGGLGPMQRPMGPMMMGLPMVMPGMMGGFPPGMMLPGVPPMMRPPPAAAAAGKESWKEHKAPDGRTYYYNIHTMESRWTKPDEMDDDDAPPSAAEAKPEPVSEEKKEADAAAEKRAKEEEQAAKEKAAKEEQARNEKMSEEEKSRQQQRPVATKPVPGTPWCVVWTGDEKVFFFNPTTRLSMWERPEELKDRVDVDKILADPPHKRKLEEDKSQAAAATEEPAKKKLKESKKEESEAAAAKGEKAVVPYETRAAQFEEMLLERQVSAFSTWEKELHKIVFDERYSLISAKERKQVFDHFVKTRAENERKEKKAQILKAREDFKALLGEVNYSLKMGFSEFASRYAKEARFRAIDKMKDREAIFNDFVTEMKKRKEEDERNKVDKMKLDFFLLMEEKKVEKYSRWSRAKEKICQDARFTAIESHIQKEQWWDEYVSKHKQSAPNEDEKRKKRAEESIKAREEEVEREKAERRAEIDTERQRHRLDEAAQHFKALLVDMVRNPDVSWSDTKRQLKKDNRWDLASLLTRDDKERHFVTHIDTLNKRKRGSFKHLLEEIGEIKLTTKWKEAKKLIKHDPRYTKFSSSDRKREREFDEYIKAKMQQAKNDLQDLLRECKLITHKTRDTVKADSKHLKEIVSVLKNDKRYLVLDCAKYEREDMLKDYIEDLHRRGPPPPPTATEPNRRLPLMK